MYALIIRKNLRQHLLSSAVTAFSIALASGLLMSIFAIQHQARTTFAQVTGGYDAVLGARGSKLQLVLNAVFHLDESPGNLRWIDFTNAVNDPNVQAAVPLALGDNYQGYRVVGVTTNFFYETRNAKGAAVKLQAPGRFFDPSRREAVVGSVAAHQLGLAPGSTFHPEHGLRESGETEHEETYVIVGVLEPSNTPIDRVLWIPLAGIQQMSGHDPAAATDISAVLLKLKGSGQAGFLLDRKYNKEGAALTFAWPIGRVTAQLFDRIAWLQQVLVLVAYVVAVVAAASVLASIYNSMNERRRDIAILRAMGARRRLIFSTVVGEAAAIGLLGALAGYLVYGVIILAATSIVRQQTGVTLDPWTLHGALLWAPLLLVGLSAASGIVPALKAYRTDVATNLAPVA